MASPVYAAENIGAEGSNPGTVITESQDNSGEETSEDITSSSAESIQESESEDSSEDVVSSSSSAASESIQEGDSTESSETVISSSGSAGNIQEESSETEESEEEPSVQLFSTQASSAVTEEVHVNYKTHIQRSGWEEQTVSDGATSGTTGKSLRLEAIKISLSGTGYSGSVQYKTHIQSYGWEKNWVSDGAQSGTTGRGKRLEAIEIKLSGDIASKYDIYYRVHAQHFGWMGWAKNGEEAGTSGYSYRLEAIQIRLVKKGDSAPANDGNTTSAYCHPLVSYSTHVQNIGWQSARVDGNMAGTSGKSYRLEAIRISLPEQEYSGSIQYRTHIQSYGWESKWKSNGATSGTEGKGKRLEAIQIRLTGDMASHYDIYYRVHIQHFGWLDWVKNGAEAGSSGFSYRLEAIQIVILSKGSDKPGITYCGQTGDAESGYITYHHHSYPTLKSLGINYSNATNRKVDKELIKMDAWIQACYRNVDITKESNYNKARDILTYVGYNFTYGEGYNVNSMLDNRTGTCFGFSDLVYCLARKLGLKNSWLTVPGRCVDHGMNWYGSQHRTVVSYFDGKYYDLDGNLAYNWSWTGSAIPPEEISKSYANYLRGLSDSYSSIN